MIKNPALKIIDEEVLNYIREEFIIELLDSTCSFSEGPVWHPDGYYLFSDIPQNCINKIAPGTKKQLFLNHSGTNSERAEYLSEQIGSNGLAYDAAGNLLICQHGNGAIAKWDGKNLDLLVSNYEGKRFNSPNDIVVGKDGRIFFSDPPYGLKEQQLRPDLAQAEAALYCWDNGSIHSFYNGYRYPNGVCISGDGRFLYTSSNKPSEAFINEFDTATLAFVRVVAKENSDGIKCDRHNNFYLANKEGVLIINKEGKRIGLISLPTVPANLCWGGREGNDLFITARENIFLIPDLQRNVVP